MHVFFEVVKFKGQMGYYRDLIKNQGPAKLTSPDDNFPSWFDYMYLGEHLSYKYKKYQIK